MFKGIRKVWDRLWERFYWSPCGIWLDNNWDLPAMILACAVWVIVFSVLGELIFH